MMPNTLRFVVSGQSQDESHDGFQVALQDLLGRDVMHPDPFSGHELKDPVQVVTHSLQRFRIVFDSGNLLSS